MKGRLPAEAVARGQIHAAIAMGKPLYRHPTFPTHEVRAADVQPGDVLADPATGAALVVTATGAAFGCVLYVRSPADPGTDPTHKLHPSPDAVLHRAVHQRSERTTPMSSTTFNSRTAWNGATTEIVPVSALAVGDCIYLGVDLAPHRVRAIDHFPDGHVNVLGSPASLLTQVPWVSLGVHTPTDTVKRVVLA